jgi:hypothetical protein
MSTSASVVAGVDFVSDSGISRMAPFEDPGGNVLMLHHRYAPRTPQG